jgi:transposase
VAEQLGAEPDRWQIVPIVVERDGSLVLHAEPTRMSVACPVCGTLSLRQHSSYQRRPLDLPWRGAIVHLHVRTRRWFSDEPTCPRKIFAERFDDRMAARGESPSLRITPVAIGGAAPHLAGPQ